MDKLQRLVATVRGSQGKRPSPRTPAQKEQHQRNVPYLPPELWILILRYATSSCAPPDHSSRTVSFLSLAHSHCHLPLRLAHYRATMRRKALMTLVCKAWYTLAQEVLFEFVWISRASEARSLAATLVRDGPDGPGRYIRRLHIETPSLERCCPNEIRTILDCAPRLVVYSDYRSVRRNIYLESCYPRSSPKALLSALAHPNNSLRRLSWTNYEDVSFHLHMSPMLETTAANLEFLELNFCSTHLHSMSSSSPALCPEAITLTLPALRSLKVTLDNATFDVLATWHMPALRNLSVLSADFSYASAGFSHFFIVHGPKLTQLELGHSSSTIEEHYLTAQPLPATLGQQQQGQGQAQGQAQAQGAGGIPLAAWCPNLVEFICSADAEWNWQNPDWIAPHVLLPTHPTLQFIGIRDIDKRLRDDLAMHLSHHHHSHVPHSQQQGGENDGQPFFMLLEQIASLVRREAFPALLYIRDMSWESDLMRRGAAHFGGASAGASASAVGVVHEAGPSSSRGTSVVGAGENVANRRRAGSLGAFGSLFGTRGRKGNRRRGMSDVGAGDVSEETRQVLRFWQAVLERCREGGVWMEDFRGVNVTMRDLRRAEAGKGEGVGGLEFAVVDGVGW
ncbi:hypothetical protein LshimejAT787_0311720 [Lyophyllum shimeji]|uniref:F-box domain-containing protein n=1 Tax=Lyophyllum shimeji TaxID=47721 RepID=A0A9P3PIM0_LYOSH|nr:hypothetical protein LshimejAT787_0311720 [Lyophyllum shimeji]